MWYAHAQRVRGQTARYWLFAISSPSHLTARHCFDYSDKIHISRNYLLVETGKFAVIQKKLATTKSPFHIKIATCIVKFIRRILASENLHGKLILFGLSTACNVEHSMWCRPNFSKNYQTVSHRCSQYFFWCAFFPKKFITFFTFFSRRP